MGGCCCSSRKSQLNGMPVYYYYPPILQDHESLASQDSAASSITTGLLDDLNLDMSSPDTFRPPPAPIPYDLVLGHPQSTDFVPLEERIRHGSFNMATCLDPVKTNCKAQAGFIHTSPTKFGIEKLKSNEIDVLAMEEEDVCPTCLDDYDTENPKITTKCNHHFHLSCILEWMERSDSCPICNQEMKLETS